MVVRHTVGVKDSLFVELTMAGNGAEAEIGVAMFLKGLAVEMDLLKRVGEPWDAEKARHQVDLWLGWTHNRMHPIEVKSLESKFSGDPLEYRHPMIELDNMDFDDKDPKPIAYINYSRQTKEWFWLNVGTTRQYWFTKTRSSSYHDHDITKYVCPRQHWRTADSFIPWLKEVP